MTVGMDTVATAEAWLGRFITGDFDGAAALSDPNVEMRALLPDGPQTYNGREEVADRLRWWFGTGDEVRWVHAEARVVEDRELSYGFRILNAVDGAKPGWHAIEQRAFCDIGTMIERVDLVCSGFRPIIEASAQLHRFDAGDMGCGDGLPQEFRRWVRSIPVGDVMEVVTKDPAAKEDLPSLARLMGNTVTSIEALEDGRLLISVEHGK